MAQVQVEHLVFDFSAGVAPFQYEQSGAVVAGWPNGSKVVDVIATDAKSGAVTAWFIEVKDFRIIMQPPKPANLQKLAQTVERKVRDSLSGVKAVAASSANCAAQKHAAVASRAAHRRVVLHLEPYGGGPHSFLFPHGFAANVLMKLQSQVRDIDPKPLVLRVSTTPKAGVPWSVR
ncbi:hypothetical protein KKB55_08395 [Myxococcota bacterium]|nr:hypothetical protein [Myxococcota bacterium]MBU1897765.1 hypothetical protein [Myxococcota bacterium]